MGSSVFQRSAAIVVRTTTTAAADLRGQVTTEAPSSASTGPDQAERAVQTRPISGIRSPDGMR